jgi:hypothetical protein
MNQNNLSAEKGIKPLNTDTDIPVSFDTALTDILTPNAFLSSLGITREKREAAIKQLAQAVIKPNGIPDDFQTQIPFMVTEGPFIKEDFLMVNVSLKKKNGAGVITLSLAEEPE